MTERSHIFERIDDYLNGNMSGEEHLAFEQKIAEDEALAAKVDEMRFTNEAVYYASLSIFKENIRKDLAEIEYAPDSRINWKIWVSIMLISAGLLAGGYKYLVNKESTATQNNVAADTGPFKERIDPSDLTSETTDKKGTVRDLVAEKSNNSQPKNRTTETVKLADTPAIKVERDTTETIQKVNSFGENDPGTSTKNQQVRSDSIPEKTPEYKAADRTVACTKSFEIKTSPSCKGKPTGTISVVSQNQEELSIEIDKISGSHSDKVFRDISSGTYEVTVSYTNACSFTERVVVEEKWCPLNTSYSFNPDYGEKWEIRYEQGDEGKFVIYNSFGKELYESQFGLGNEYWDGTDYNGTKAPTGNYVAIIKYSDGRNERVELTIVR